MKVKPTVAKPVHPNVGVEMAYRRKLDRMITRMHKSLIYWLAAAYRANEPEMAQDDSPAAALRNAMRGLSRRWTREFAQLAKEWGPDFCRDVSGVSERAFAAALRKAGFTVKFKLTPAVNDVLQASIAENVALIKSIAQQHLTQVEGLVMRSVQQGRRLDELSDRLQEQYGVTRRRAALIARDQNNKVTAAITRARQNDLGITTAKWLHSGGGKHPRPSHVKMNNQVYDTRKGMWDPDEKRYIFPGELINCRCVSRSIIPGFS